MSDKWRTSFGSNSTNNLQDIQEYSISLKKTHENPPKPTNEAAFLKLQRLTHNRY